MKPKTTNLQRPVTVRELDTRGKSPVNQNSFEHTGEAESSSEAVLRTAQMKGNSSEEASNKPKRKPVEVHREPLSKMGLLGF